MQGNEAIATELQVRIPIIWTEFGTEMMAYALTCLLEDPDSDGWWAYLPIHINDNLLIGSCGYKGKPDERGIVEIGYEVIPPYRGRGYATEIAATLIQHAFGDTRVRMVRAHTLAQENASAHILQKCGMEHVDTLDDPDDGLIWRWELNLERWRAGQSAG